MTPSISKSVPAFTPRLELNGKEPLAFSLGPFSQISFKIKATLPVADIYKGNFDVFYNGQRVSLPMHIR